MPHHRVFVSLRLGLALCGAVLLACASCAPSSQNTSGSGEGATGSALVRGSSRDAPVQVCGPRESYAYVASDFVCPDGSNPLGGSLRAGSRARAGSIGAGADGHILDMYEVPCPGGPVQVYIDMYHCPDGRSPF